jgi:hypothetical protein
MNKEIAVPNKNAVVHIFVWFLTHLNCTVYLFYSIAHNVLHMACADFEELSYPPKPKLAKKKKPCWPPINRHKTICGVMRIHFLI